jgi:regulatory protein
MFNQRLTKEQALPKIKQYCAYQERCHQEVKDKLYGYGLYKNDVELLISQLIEENYLNEERFARHFASGKFRIKQWGRRKIIYGLKEKNVNPYCIKLGMKEIDEMEYEKVLFVLAEKKWASLKGEQHIVREVKTRNFLAQRGFENELVGKILAKIR